MIVNIVYHIDGILTEIHLFKLYKKWSQYLEISDKATIASVRVLIVCISLEFKELQTISNSVRQNMMDQYQNHPQIHTNFYEKLDWLNGNYWESIKFYKVSPK